MVKIAVRRIPTIQLMMFNRTRERWERAEPLTILKGRTVVVIVVEGGERGEERRRRRKSS